MHYRPQISVKACLNLNLLDGNNFPSEIGFSLPELPQKDWRSLPASSLTTLFISPIPASVLKISLKNAFLMPESLSPSSRNQFNRRNCSYPQWFTYLMNIIMHRDIKLILQAAIIFSASLNPLFSVSWNNLSQNSRSWSFPNHRGPARDVVCPHTVHFSSIWAASPNFHFLSPQLKQCERNPISFTHSSASFIPFFTDAKSLT